jgi:hypothetical protein
MGRWEEGLLQDFVGALQHAAAAWSDPGMSLPACRVLHLLLVGREAPPARSDRQSTRVPLTMATWLWMTEPSSHGPNPSSCQCPGLLCSWELAATRLIDLHSIVSPSQERSTMSQPAPRNHRRPRRRCRTAEDAPPPRTEEENEPAEPAVPTNRPGGPSSAAPPVLHPERARPPLSAVELHGSDDATTVSKLLQWMAVSLPLFTDWGLSALELAMDGKEAEAPRPSPSEEEVDGSAPSGDDVVAGLLPPPSTPSSRPLPPLLARRLLATVLDVLELVVLPLLNEESQAQDQRGSDERDDGGDDEMMDEAVPAAASSSSSLSSEDVVVLMRFASQCASFMTRLARLDPTCSTVRPSSSSASKSHLVLLRAEMPTTRSTSDRWDRASSAIAVATGLLYAAAVTREGRDQCDAAAACTPSVVLEEESYLIHRLVGFFHQLLLQVQWERRWRTERRKLNGSAFTGRVTSSNDAANSSAKKRAMVTFWQLLAPCRHWYLTASALLRHSLRDKTTFLESDDDINAPDKAEEEDGILGETDDDVRRMLGLQIDELVDDEDELLQH